jgi:starch synthase (maltosyl-transferring)
MMPAGFEFGFQKKPHVVKTRPSDWEKPTYDLTTYITQVNRLKKNCPVLLEEGPIVRVEAPGPGPVALLLKSREERPGRVLAVINPTDAEQQVDLADLPALLGKPASAWQDLTPDMIPLPLKPSLDFSLAPFRMRLLYNPKAKPLAVEAEPEEEGADA